MLGWISAYGAAAIVFFGLDFLWLTNMTASFYRPRLGALLLDQPNLYGAAAFYLLYIAGIVQLAVVPALAPGGSWTAALVAGAVLGLIAYGTYDMTNLATLKGWSLSVSLVDMAWGTVLTGLAATAGWLAADWLRRGISPAG